ncbi:hypothetical protein TEA_016662 [Camellia sinensis var. sinensis]|uniref:At1g61320/AtMIF1 LRR domain-containing protein n=1 Tax=Camellia sinensis var. sinensis TaxID=542762 RepID=A0A4S4E335_CAMSN|nr:hypothetical protein TEA_016662 [Camellia sinensis var. sinensis]
MEGLKKVLRLANGGRFEVPRSEVAQAVPVSSSSASLVAVGIEEGVDLCFNDSSALSSVSYWSSSLFLERETQICRTQKKHTGPGIQYDTCSAKVQQVHQYQQMLLGIPVIVDHEDKLFGLKCRQFVDWVNHILKFHRVSGPLFKLKYLKIEGCFCLKSVDIYDANLVSFKYSGLKTYIAFKNTLHLVKASFDGPYACNFVKNFIQVSSYLLQLETLVLNLSWGLKKLRCFPRFPKLRNLRQLELMLNPGVSRLLCAYLLRASPLLRILKIEVNMLTLHL